jgi:hypothetical protein
MPATSAGGAVSGALIEMVAMRSARLMSTLTKP